MGKIQISLCVVCLVCSLIVNLLFVSDRMYMGGKWELSWSGRAAEEGEAAAAVECSGHGRAYLDGLDVDGIPLCECNSCFVAPDCSQISSDCIADVDSGDPLFLEPFWMENAASSAMLVAGWHRMSYVFKNQSLISRVLENQIRKLHTAVGNAVTQGRFILFGAGSSHLLNAAVHALSQQNSSVPTKVVASVPFYPLYQVQTDYFRSADFEFQGDTSLWKNSSDSGLNFIEIVTAPNNPDGQMNKAVLLQGPYVKAIHDHAYYWPHFTAIPAPADEDVMLFSISKLTGHAGTRFGWAVIKDEGVYQRMSTYVKVSTLGISKDAQLRAFKLLKVVMERSGREIFEFGHATMRNRWEKLSRALSVSERFSLQDIAPQYCNFFQTVRAASPAYAWLKCEREEDKECYRVLKKAGIIGRDGTLFGVGSSYVRLSIIKTQDDFDMLLHKIKILVAKGDDTQARSAM